MKCKEVDVRGLSCPEPVICVRKAMEDLLVREIEVIVDTVVAKENIARFAGNAGYKAEIINMVTAGEYKIRIKRVDQV